MITDVGYNCASNSFINRLDIISEDVVNVRERVILNASCSCIFNKEAIANYRVNVFLTEITRVEVH